ncbi:MAG: S8 family serine peptidase, partial [Myxococcota bacterium]|nr:S8 family serine peptidase [Myxococcota bacterium]
TVTLAAGGGMTTTFGGTSAAAPVVAGLAGWALSLRPDLSAAELQSILVGTAVPSPLVTHDDDGHHPIYGYGQVDPHGLWEALEPSRGTETGGDDGEPTPRSGCATAPARTQTVVAVLSALGILAGRRRAWEWTIRPDRVKVG